MTEEEIRTQMALGTFDINVLATKTLNDFRQIIENINDVTLLLKLRTLLDSQPMPGIYTTTEITKMDYNQRNIITRRLVTLINN